MEWRGGSRFRSLAGDRRADYPRARVRLLCAAVFASLLSAPAHAQPADLDPSAPLDPMPDLGVEWPDLDAPEQPSVARPAAGEEAADLPDLPAVSADAAAELRYTVSIEGLEQIATEELIAAFDDQSALRKGRGDPANAAQVDRRSRADAELLAELLRSKGYYDAAVEPRIDRSADALVVVLEAAPGAQYRFQSVELPGLEAAGPEAASLREAFAVKPGDPIVAADVIAAGIALKVALGEQGFALAEVGEQDIEIDHESHRASLRLPVQPGPLATFGELRVSGEPPFGAKHVAQIARFGPGDQFKRSKVDDLRRALIATGLVASAEVRVVPAGDGRTVDLAVVLEPAPMRTIAGELGYGTGEGVRIEASWQHRNFFNPEGALTLRGVAGTQEQLAAVQFRRNNFRGRDQVLNLIASASHADRDAYEAKTLLIGGSFERQSNIIWH